MERLYVSLCNVSWLSIQLSLVGPPTPLGLLELKEKKLMGTLLEIELMLKSHRMLTKMAAKGPKFATLEILANFEALWLRVCKITTICGIQI